MIKNLENMTAGEIYFDYSNRHNFDYEKGLDELIKKDYDGSWIYSAGSTWKKFNYEKGLKALRKTSYYRDALKKWPKGIKQSQKIIDRLKSKSTKLPNKPLKLESMLESLSKELLSTPPHYIVDGYKVILTPDINMNNYSQFVNTFRAGRIISSGKVSEMNDDFTQELIYKTMNNNKLKIDNNFYFVIFEDLNG